MTDGPTAGTRQRARPNREPSSAGLSDEDSRLTTSTRALALGALSSGRRQATEGIEQNPLGLGLPVDLARPTGREQRITGLAESHAVLRRVAASDVVESEFAPRRSGGRRSIDPRFPVRDEPVAQESPWARTPQMAACDG
jgi:hypothetical protein